MSNLFVSHSSKDGAIAQAIVARLKIEGYRSLFLDFDPENGIPAGRKWELELYRQLRVCVAVLVLCSEHSMQSRWCFAEIIQARALGKRIIPFRISACKVEITLMDTQQIDGTTLSEESYQRLWAALKVAALDARDSFDWDPTRSPYPGLYSFEECDAAVYFGRTKETRELLERLNNMRSYRDPRWTVIIGASGSGKSSLARAGVIPRLKKDPSRWTVLPPFRPGRIPLEQLRRSLQDFCQRNLLNTPSIHRPLESGARLAEIGSELTVAIGQKDSTVLLVIDQLEELFSNATPECNEFIEFVLDATSTPDSPIFVLATLRSDFFVSLQGHPSMAADRFFAMSLGPMSRDSFVEVIVKPAQLAAIELEPGLAERMSLDTETEDALPLLAFALSKMYQRSDHKHGLTLAAYNELGKIQGAVAGVAEDIAQGFRSPGLEEALRTSFLKMVRVNESGQFVRQRIPWHEMSAEANPILEKFVDSRLLVSRVESSGVRVVEVAHEALFRTWDRLATWLAQDSEFLRWKQRMRADLTIWEAMEHNESALLYGVELAAAEPWLSARRSDLNEREQQFILASIALRDAAKQERELLLTQTQRQRVIAEAQSLGVTALREFESGRGPEALLTALRAGENLRTIDGDQAAPYLCSAPNVLLALQTILDDIYEFSRREHAAQPPEFGRGATYLAPSRLKVITKRGEKKRARSLTDEELIDIMGQEGRILIKAFSQDGHYLITSATDGTVRIKDLWETAPAKLIGLQGAATELVFIEDGERFTTNNVWGTMVHWDLARWHIEQHTMTVSGHRVATRIAKFSQEGTLLATGGMDGGVSIWSDAGAIIRSRKKICSGSICGISFIPHKDSVCIVGNDGSIKIWNFADDRVESRVKAGNIVIDVAFSEDGSRVATALAGGSAAIRQLKTGEEAQLEAGHHGWIMGIDLARDGGQVITGGADDTVRVCDHRGRSIGAPLSAGQEQVMSVSLSPDNNLIATAGSDGTVKLWRDHAQVARCVGHRGKVLQVRFSADGNLVASSGVDGTVRLWLRSGEQIAHFKGCVGPLSREGLARPSQN